MAYTWKENLVASSKYSIKCPYALTPQYVTIHNTSNDAAAANEISYMISNSNSTSYHIAVDDKQAIQGIPFTRNAWHAGDGASGNGNRKSIGIEICYSKSGGSKYTAAEENAVYVAARVLHKFNLPIDRLKKHQDWSGKKCPHRILDEGRWASFKERVNTVLKAIKAGTTSGSLSAGTTAINKPASSSSSSSSSSTTFKVGDYNNYVTTTDNLNVRSSRSASASILTTIPKGTKIKIGYIMYEGNKTTGTTLWGGTTYNGQTGFVSMNYVKPYTEPVVTTGTASKFEVGSLNKKVRIINCTTLNTHSSRDLTSATVNGSIKAGTVVTVGYIMYEGNKTTGTTLMGGVVIDGKQCFISMKYCQLV